MPESKSATIDLLLKALIGVILSLCTAIGSMTAWYVKSLRDEVVDMRKELRAVSNVQTRQLGGNPYEEPE